MGKYMLIAAAFVMTDTGILAAQQKPDFSGERILNRQASVLSPAMSGVQSGTQRIEHDEPTIRVHLTLVVDGKPFETVLERLTDGRDITESRQGRPSISSVRWDGEALVFSMRSSGPNCEGTLSIRYELRDGGRTVQATERIRGCDRDQDNVWVFERR
jgi:hypothetical protein